MSTFTKSPFVDACYEPGITKYDQECPDGCQCPAVTAAAKGLKQNGCAKIHDFRSNGKPFTVMSTNHTAAA